MQTDNSDGAKKSSSDLSSYISLLIWFVEVLVHTILNKHAKLNNVVTVKVLSSFLSSVKLWFKLGTEFLRCLECLFPLGQVTPIHRIHDLFLDSREKSEYLVLFIAHIVLKWIVIGSRVFKA